MEFSGIGRPLVIAHRGYRGKYPENTLAAFNGAVDAGARMIELDVTLTKDRKLVVIHDDTLDRTTNGAGQVGGHLLSALKRLDAGSWFDTRFKNERLPELEEVFDAVGGRASLNIEIKSSAYEAEQPSDAIEKQVLDLIHSKNCEDSVIISSFNYDVLKNVRRLDTRLPVSIISREKPGKKTLAKYRALDLFSWHPDRGIVTRRDVEEMHKEQIAVFPYTVNAPKDADRLIHMGVDGIFTDDPGLMIHHLMKFSQSARKNHSEGIWGERV